MSGDAPDVPANGPAAAAIIAAALGCFVLGVFALAGDAFAAAGDFFVFYRPVGALSGVTTSAISLWLAAWLLLDRLWRRRNVAMLPVSLVAFGLLFASLLLTFPPFMDFVQGK
ncbi:MAG TPA: hypothetical protein VGF33_09855 [Caulobacteraceae bacterium]